MTGLTRFLIYSAAFVVPPAIAAVVGLRALRARDHPARLPAIDAASAARTPRPDLDAAKPTLVVVLGSDLTEITDALGPYEMFARTGKFNVVMAAPARQPTSLTGGLRILPHYALSEVDARLGGPPAVVVVPNLPNAADPANRPVIDWLRRQAAAGALMHSWCKGAMALAEAGLLDGRVATAHWGDLPQLEKRYPKVRWVRGVRWVEHGQYVMSAGITSGVDAALRVIIRLAGDSVARRVATEIRYPDHHFAVDPRTTQYTLRPADLILLANAAYRVARPRLGIALYDGVGEIDLSNVYDAHLHTMAATGETVAERAGAVVTRHGLTLFPSLPLVGRAGDAASRLGRLDRLVVPGPEGSEHAASLAAAVTAAAPSLRPEYLHADQPARFGLEPVLEDLARTADVPTATFAQRRMEYRSRGVRLDGGHVPWAVLWPAAALGALGVLGAIALSRLRTPGRRAVRSAGSVESTVTPTTRRQYATRRPSRG
jgi:putative intracellular protease/amidase